MARSNLRFIAIKVTTVGIIHPIFELCKCFAQFKLLNFYKVLLFTDMQGEAWGNTGKLGMHREAKILFFYLKQRESKDLGNDFRTLWRYKGEKIT